jgi:secreted trypsin-like serine protease
MLQLLAFSALVATVLADIPQWYNGPCGVSKFSDAGDMNLPSSRMIVGGQAARAHEFPWMASVRRKSTNSHFCGGSIINTRWILTAAHCMSGETPAIVSVVIGDHTRNDASNTVRRSLDVERIFMHPQYNSRTLINDAALIKVVQTIGFTADIQPVCGPDNSLTYAYSKCSCSGWGTLVSGGACCPQTLQYVTMNVTTNAYCNAAYPRDNITADMICATDNTGSRDRDSCQGDSGGPLVVKESNGVFRHIGIVSWGIGCASGYPGVYSRTSHHHTWILTTITNN